MKRTLHARHDRAGHGVQSVHKLRVARVFALALCGATVTASTAGRRAHAQSLDGRGRITTQEAFDVAERVTVAFGDGVFHEVWGDIPNRRTNAADTVSAGGGAAGAAGGAGSGAA